MGTENNKKPADIILAVDLTPSCVKPSNMKKKRRVFNSFNDSVTTTEIIWNRMT
jgi:hypothetical protein